MEKVIIVGGGVAGLSCLNALLDQGVSPLLIEGSTIGAPKMCGEFLSPEALPFLETWEIGPLQKIKQAVFLTKENKSFKIDFKNSAAAISRKEVELLLAKRARKLNGRIVENKKIIKIIPSTANNPYIFYFESGETIQADTAIFAIGKHLSKNQTPLLFPFYGIKLHFQHIVEAETLYMQSLKNAYFGIVPISAQWSNCTFLIKKAIIDKKGSCQKYIDDLLKENNLLSNFKNIIRIEKLEWLESKTPAFQPKIIPNWKKAFWIGDAFASLYPAIGSGFSHSISSAVLAANCYMQTCSRNYLRQMKKKIKPKIYLGKAMHQVMLNPYFANITFHMFKKMPWLLESCLQRLNYSDH